MVDPSYRQMTDFLLSLGAEQVAHTGKSFLAHLIGVYNLMKAEGCDQDLCRAGMFHSIYSTETFQHFKLDLERRGELRGLIGERAERLAYLNCAMNRASFDSAVEQDTDSYRIVDRLTGQEIELRREEFDDLCRVHLYDWLEQVPRSRFGWGYRREAYRRMADRLGSVAQQAHDRVYAEEPAVAGA